MIPYGKQYIDKNDVKSVIQSLKSSLLTTGPLVKKFETYLSDFLKCKYSIVCNSGTSGLFLAMQGIELKKNDIVILPAINFIASYNVSKFMDAKIYLADVDPETGQMTPKTLLECIQTNKLKKIKAIVTMYLGGFPENIEGFYKLKKIYNFLIIEDACHAFGSSYKIGKKKYMLGSCKHSDLAVFSFHPLKSITTGEGGAITTNNKSIYNKIILSRSNGIKRNIKEHWKYDVTTHGNNFRLSDLNCALGISQLKKIKMFIKKRSKNYEMYKSALSNHSKFMKFPNYSCNLSSAHHLTIININFKSLKKKKDQFFHYLKQNGILAQYHYIPIYRFTSVKSKKKLKNTEKYYSNSISLPNYFSLSKINHNKVIRLIKKFIDSSKL